MKSLYRQFVAATLGMLAVSIIIGFLLANLYYMNVTKENNDRHHVEIAQEVATVLETMHETEAGMETYLQSVAKLGYQIYVVDELGNENYYGSAFDDTELPPKANLVLSEQEIYHGMNESSNQNFMMGHFANELKNTVGVPFLFDGEQYGLFLRPDIKLISTDIHTVLLGFIVAIAIVSILGMLWLTKHLTKPISQLTEATRQIAKENYSYPLNIQRKDEIGELAQSFNSMQVQLHHNDRARKSFISDVSHDFQSPLMNIQGYSDLLKSDTLSDQERSEYVAIIDQEAKRLSSLTKQLLLLTSLDQQTYPLKYTEIRLDEQLRGIIRKFRWRLEENNIDISYKLAPTCIWGDEELLVNLWENLLTNAIKYNQIGGHIDIDLTSDGEKATVTFKDTGIGVSQEAIAKIFDRFYRVDAARKKDGTGLGLSIAQQIAALHEGTIEIESMEGVGSTFTTTLPLRIEQEK